MKDKNRSTTLGLGILVSFWLLAISAHGAKLYRWEDEDGRVHYSDKAPAESAVEADDITGGLKPLNLGHGEETNPIEDVFPKETDAEANFRKEQTQLKHAERQKHLAQCHRARRDLETIRGRVIFLKNGKPVEVSEDERQRRAENLQQLIQRHCRQ